MLPLYPPYAIADLAHEHLEGRLPDGRPRRRPDPDRFLDESSALQPDPMFMVLRSAVISGPIGRLMRWVDARAEAREERAVGSPRGDVAVASAPIVREPLHFDQEDERPDRRTAA